MRVFCFSSLRCMYLFCLLHSFCHRKNFGLRSNRLVVRRKSTSWLFMMTVSLQQQIQKVLLFQTFVKSHWTCPMLRYSIRNKGRLLVPEILLASSTKCSSTTKKPLNPGAAELSKYQKLKWNGTSLCPKMNPNLKKRKNMLVPTKIPSCHRDRSLAKHLPIKIAIQPKPKCLSLARTLLEQRVSAKIHLQQGLTAWKTHLHLHHHPLSGRFCLHHPAGKESALVVFLLHSQYPIVCRSFGPSRRGASPHERRGSSPPRLTSQSALDASSTPIVLQDSFNTNSETLADSSSNAPPESASHQPTPPSKRYIFF